MNYAGSGKTTFVNYLLREHHGLRLAIVENEFGEVAIDDGLVLQVKFIHEPIKFKILIASPPL
jgi:G3E family GTPase